MSLLLDRIGKYFPFLRLKPSLPREEMLSLRPVRNPAVTWEKREQDESETDDTVYPPVATLTIPRRQDKLGSLLSKIFVMPTHRTIELDEYGTKIWEMCDGTQCVSQFVTYTSTAYKLNRRQAEVSVVAFMRMLTQRRLIGFSIEQKGKSNANRQQNGTQGRKHRNRGRGFHN